MAMISGYSNEVRMISVRHGQTVRNAGPLDDGIRHIQGQVNNEAAQLTQEGIDQALTVGRALAVEYPEVDVIYTSPLQRCRDTAEKIARCFLEKHGKTLKVFVDWRLSEIDHGKWDTMDVNLRNQSCQASYERILNDKEECARLIQKFQNEHPDVDLYENPERFIKWIYNPMVEIPLETAGRELNHLEILSKKGSPETIMQVFMRVLAAFKEIGNMHFSGDTVIVCSHGGALSTLATEMELSQAGDLQTIRPTYYEPGLKGSKVVSGNCSEQMFLYNKNTKVLRFESSRDLNKLINKA